MKTLFEKKTPTFHYPGTTLWNSFPITLKESKRLEHFKRYSKIYFLRNESEISLLDAIVLKCNIALVLAMHYVNVMYKCILVFTFMIIYCI